MNIQFDKTSIEYASRGSGGTTLLFIHGWCINKDYWQQQLDFFSGKYKCVAIDLPGFGQSTADRENWSIEAYGRDLLQVIDHLELKNIVLIGHSMAGEICLELLHKPHPEVKGFVGIDNFKAIDISYTPEQYEQFADMMKMLESDFSNTAPGYADHMLLHPTTPEALSQRIKNDFAKADPQVGFSSLSNLIQFSMTEASKLETLGYKLHLLSSNIIPTNVAGLEKHCKNGFALTEISATSHYPMIENPQEFNKSLQGILEEIEAG